MKKIIYTVIFGAFTLSGAPSTAQIAVRFNCYSDMQRLCPAELKSRDQEKMRVCLRTNLNKASEECRRAVHSMIDSQQRDRKP